MEGYIPNYLSNNPNFRKALDSEASGEAAPMAKRIRDSMRITERAGANKAQILHAIKLAGGLEAFLTIHLLAHTSPAQDFAAVRRCFDYVKKAGLEVLPAYKYALSKASQVRIDVGDALVEIPKRAAVQNAKMPVIDTRGIIDDDGKEAILAEDDGADLEIDDPIVVEE